MTREEARLTLQENLDYLSFEHPGKIIEAIKVAIKVLSESSLPSNLEDAAGGYANKEFPDEPACGQWGTGDYEPPVDYEYPREIAKDSFQAGAQWKTEQNKLTLYSVEEQIKQGVLETEWDVYNEFEKQLKQE